MAINTRPLSYTIDGKEYEAIVASGGDGPKPGVLVCHAWAGRSEGEVGFARELAALGYTGVAVDLYGKGVLGASKEENQKLMTPFIEDREMLRARLLDIVEIVKDQPEVDASNVAAIGFCFGGLCVLNLARAGGDVKGVVSFHGLLGNPGNSSGAKITSKILVLHGWDDPMVPPDDVVAFSREMTEAGADWQVQIHGGAMHAFMNKEANDPGFGTVYNKSAAERSWQSMQNFLAEIFN